MCGIFGKIYLDKSQKVSKTDLIKMNNSLIHRGLDDQGFKTFGNLGIGNLRLAIIDLSKKGHQPMSDDAGEVWVVFNGEIYNFQSLRQTLIKKGHKFKSNSDTEVIIASYKAYGIDCL